ncbi:pirin family protein [Pseudoalteromonas ruthenica]|uniref:pirin family protein n=1 Tax=Pseudoalteromonas ruthenica TaxID=151081 RepID=UPI001109565B|nr:pirin family protein [Pseudoalteromonas ruthenica]TLX51381.1 pirin family protein [Pseudoalteromonas ruthenica]
MNVIKVLNAQPAEDGAGVKIRRVPGFDGRYLDPFLMLDELKSDHSDDYMAGFPAHPHRGIETFTYLIKGGFEHRDHLGNRKAVRAGDVQWMSTGKGVIHSEMPLADSEGLHGFQIWLNMDAKDKMNAPQYQDSAQSGLPQISSQGVHLKALAGAWTLNAEQVQSPLSNLACNGAIADINIDSKAQLEMPAMGCERVLAYIHTGSITAAGQRYQAGQLLVLDGDSAIIATTDQPSGLLLLRGEPLHQPIAHMGPFVMNTQAQLQDAIRDYQNGQFGQLSQ